MTKAEHLEAGELGERLARKYLQKKGFSIIEINFRKKFGEIDIVALKGQVLCFIEVKTIRMHHPSSKGHGFNPLENVHNAKQARLARTIQSYLLEKSNEDREWRFDVVAIKLDTEEKRAHVEHFENIILEV